MVNFLKEIKTKQTEGKYIIWLKTNRNEITTQKWQNIVFENTVHNQDNSRKIVNKFRIHSKALIKYFMTYISQGKHRSLFGGNYD